MGDEKSNDVLEVIQDEEEKPIMSLFKRLISSDNKQNTVLTNAQIKEILRKEFDIDTDELHELEGDIYLDVMKKFLKDWPQWDEFDHTIIKFKFKRDDTGLNNILDIKYRSLKKYLRLMLSIAEPLAQQNVKNLGSLGVKTPKQKKIDDIILEVHCNRAQLNKLFYKQPHPETGTLFNTSPIPSGIIVSKPSIAGILNSFGICIVLSIHSFRITRFTCHEIKHVLVNKKLKVPQDNNKHIPNELIQKKQISKNSTNWIIKKIHIVDMFVSVYKSFKLKNSAEAMAVLEVIIMDLAEGPEIFEIKEYRKYMSKYAYKRYLNADLPDETESNEKYDLTLEETICPRYHYTIHRRKSNVSTDKQKMDDYSLQIECTQCGIKFSGVNILSDLEEHYLDFHSQEPDVICTNCKKTFSFDYLTNKRWRHEC